MLRRVPPRADGHRAIGDSERLGHVWCRVRNPRGHEQLRAVGDGRQFDERLLREDPRGAQQQRNGAEWRACRRRCRLDDRRARGCYRTEVETRIGGGVGELRRRGEDHVRPAFEERATERHERSHIPPRPDCAERELHVDPRPCCIIQCSRSAQLFCANGSGLSRSAPQRSAGARVRPFHF